VNESDEDFGLLNGVVISLVDDEATTQTRIPIATAPTVVAKRKVEAKCPHCGKELT